MRAVKHIQLYSGNYSLQSDCTMNVYGSIEWYVNVCVSDPCVYVCLTICGNSCGGKSTFESTVDAAYINISIYPSVIHTYPAARLSHVCVRAAGIIENDISIKYIIME